MPEALPFLATCESPPGGIPFSFQQYDPDVIWWKAIALSRVFFTNCTALRQTLPLDTEIDQVLPVAKAAGLKTYLFSLAKCVPTGEVKPGGRSEEDNASLAMRHINNQLICNSNLMDSGFLYYFDYRSTTNH